MMSEVALSQLLEGITAGLPIRQDIIVRGITSDSRQVKPGYVFAAVKGAAHDGHDYLSQAAEKGAVAALVENADSRAPIPQIVTADVNAALAQAAMNFYGRPAGGMRVVGITGTNGKTSTSYLLESLLISGGKTGVIGTVEMRCPGFSRPALLTTPDPVTLASALREMADKGVSALVMEVSSHALQQKRVNGLDFDVAVFTNLSRDHLDYHKSMSQYSAAKALLFNTLLPQSASRGKDPLAVINNDDPEGLKLLRDCREAGIRCISYGCAGQVRPYEVEYGMAGIQARLETPLGKIMLISRLLGTFNLYNLMAAAAVGVGMGFSLQHITDALFSCEIIPGRLEKVKYDRPGPLVLVDYAHTDDALHQSLSALRTLNIKGRLICVFGAGGNRDRGKRPMMGEAVARWADVALITSDNPRDEDPLDIINMILPGLDSNGFKCEPFWTGSPMSYICEPDRAKAIAVAILEADDNDVILIAGKGHETYQSVKGRRHFFDDREEASKALALRERRIS
ncbi:MAG: UDP-N-acetylmuramoyl-L-alanyl-D-glutamate--2,6-diaminopimelate ligase [Desulfarculales bacterium]|jgi:UDP-N-acetylmuramoyl-L-alanyl-D-glutamate--2,6-diaminopimelate ligase|nr:UDP-N-acetylmuramoyl-L-alanyl-D-glutamate--2,6-diaminopimelate ligase [Desulfarculales bacterium]